MSDVKRLEPRVTEPLAPQMSKAAMVELLSGRGIEIGALHRPLVAPHLKVRYVDNVSTADMIAAYPELAEAEPVHVDVVDDGAKLESFADDGEDFVIASHLIEHLRDPIGGLLAWQRVLKPGGRLFLMVPDRDQTFDRERAITPNHHLLADYEGLVDARCWEHVKEWALYVSCRTFGTAPEEQYEDVAHSLVAINYSIHFHVWDLPAFRGFLSFVAAKIPGWRMKVIAESGVLPDEFGFVLEKV